MGRSDALFWDRGSSNKAKGDGDPAWMPSYAFSRKIIRGCAEVNFGGGDLSRMSPFGQSVEKMSKVNKSKIFEYDFKIPTLAIASRAHFAMRKS